MKVSPLQTRNKYGVSKVEGTNDAVMRPIDLLIVTYYTINFISKLCHHARTRPPTSICNSPKILKPAKSFIRSASIEREVLLTVGLKTVDSHAMIDVDALLDSGATGLFINRALVQDNGVATYMSGQSRTRICYH